MPPSLNIPVPVSAYRQPRLVLKNRTARRSRGRAAAELTVVGGTNGNSTEPSPLPIRPSTMPAGFGMPSAPSSISSHLSQAVLLDWLGSQSVSFHRIYVDVCGSVTAAVWLSMVMSLLDGQGKAQLDQHGVFRFKLTAKACEEQTGLTEAEQRKAQRQLIERQLLSVERRKAGQPTPVFSLDMNALTQRVLTHSEGLAELLKRSDSAPEPQIDTSVLERRALARAARRSA